MDRPPERAHAHADEAFGRGGGSRARRVRGRSRRRPRAARGVGRGRRHARGHQVPARPLRLPPRRRRRPRRAPGSPSASSRCIPGSGPDRVAAIDQGTNSIRLLVVEPGATPESRGDRARSRHGHHAPRTRRRSHRPARRRGARPHRRRARRGSAAGPGRSGPSASGWERRAPCATPRTATTTRPRCASLAGSELEVITGEQEAALSFLGGTHGLDPSWGPFAVQDIGGGSTEFVTGAAPGQRGASLARPAWAACA